MDTPPTWDLYDKRAPPRTVASSPLSGAIRHQRIGLLIETINEITEVLNEKLKIYGVSINVYDKRNKLDRDTLESLPAAGEERGFYVFKTPIRISQEIKKVQSMLDTVDEDGNRIITNRSLFKNYPSSNGAIDYVHFVKELREVINHG